MPNEIIMMAKYSGHCIECRFKIEVGDLIKSNTGNKTAKHVKCWTNGFPEISKEKPIKEVNNG